MPITFTSAFTKSSKLDTIHNIMQKLQLSKKYKSGSAAEIIRDAILAGDISGEISQNEFADSLGVSRIPVREALITLEYHGLVEKLPNQHVRVITLDDESIRNIFADMSAMELETVKSLPAETLERLSSAKDQAEFHRTLYENTHSPLRRVFIRTRAQTYIAFIIEYSDASSILPAFENLKHSVKDFPELRANYAVYADSLADTLIRIRTHKEESQC